MKKRTGGEFVEPADEPESELDWDEVVDVICVGADPGPTAQAISAGDLTRRVRITGQGDEFDLLAGTINDMLDRIDNLNKVREQESRDGGHVFVPINVGIGLNTGLCTVGNMGSDSKFNYSVLGDSVKCEQRSHLHP